MKKFIILLLFIFVGISAFAVERLNFKGGFVSDNANIITENDNIAINNIIKELRRKTTAEIAVVTVTSLDGQSIENAAMEVGRRYRVGNLRSNNGIIVLVAPQEREARIELATGIINIVSDEDANKIMQEDMVAYFKKNDYSKGVYRGVASLAILIADKHGVSLTTISDAPPRIKKSISHNINSILAGIILIAAIIFGLIRSLISDDDDDYYDRHYHSGRRWGGGSGFTGKHGSTGKW